VIDAPSTVYVASAGGDRWSLEVDGTQAVRTDAFDWASAFAVEGPGSARLAFDTPTSRSLALVGQVALWVLAVLYLLRVRVVEDERDTLAPAAPVAASHVVLGSDPGSGSGDEQPLLDAPTMAVPVVTASEVPADEAPTVSDDPPPRRRRSRGRYAR
jgi:hypothetical protein